MAGDSKGYLPKVGDTIKFIRSWDSNDPKIRINIGDKAIVTCIDDRLLIGCKLYNGNNKFYNGEVPQWPSSYYELVKSFEPIIEKKEIDSGWGF